MKQVNRDGYAERSYKIMMSTPMTSLSRYIGSKWFLPLDKLSKRSGVPFTILQKAIRGEKIAPIYEARLRAYLEQL